MLRIGLTGGIGAGKSTVSATFADCGAVIVDGDVISREVVQPGTEGLAALVDHFGRDILAPDGALNRPALAAKAFVDEHQRARLNAIVHPLVARRRAELVAAVAEDEVVVEDIPLLVESGMAPLFPLVVVVHASAEVRLRRLTGRRGMAEADARARIAAQATEDQRRRVADVWLDNSGTEGQIVEAARELWSRRIRPFAHNLANGRTADDPRRPVPPDPSWPEQAERIRARLATTCGHRALRIDHVGSTAVLGLDARDIIDMQITVAGLSDADDLAADLLRAGYPRLDQITADITLDGGNVQWHKRFHGSSDPGRPTHVHIRVDGSPNQRFALLFVDWLNANPGVRADYLTLKRGGADPQSWLREAYGRAWAWAESVGWSPDQVS
ncbi:dephospho-CoA kinase [Mycolicibacterium sp.]|uniref:dephospho-CoA kinase n=1 Tax=Mycolicibacterium sp. TaxID=2320850 RepID=UPI001D5013CD|nr:dephospho-CoA kinase [Mycolicibacterium sp.]MCB1290925.1 dephospho-CoA kinase [Mycobacterium sp.]MCB9408067.1 dephospho-CoA kinase [Mycolicibacterium sp.]MCB9424218.1 dephospho-CoA kinase [Actinomycetota bacterium]